MLLFLSAQPSEVFHDQMKTLKRDRESLQFSSSSWSKLYHDIHRTWARQLSLVGQSCTAITESPKVFYEGID